MNLYRSSRIIRTYQNEDISNESLDNDVEIQTDQELVIFNLISSDKSCFNISQLFGFLSNCGAKLNNGFFCFYDEKNNETFRIINALSLVLLMMKLKLLL